MPKLNVFEVRNLSGYARLVAERADEMKWYRGVGRSSYGLVPSLYRHPSIVDAKQLLAKEAQLITRFRERAQPMVAGPLPSEKLEMLFLMQHHGMPTRLLDWSENAFVALFFALSNSEKDSNEKSIGSSCVWLLNPVSWNRSVHSHVNYSGEPFSVGDSMLRNGYMSVENSNALMENPAAVYGVHNSPRIVSQRGVFTLFGTSSAPMETVYVEAPFPNDTLKKIEIKGSHQESLFRELMSAGVLDSSVYPDLDGLARELKRAHGYKV